MTTHLTALNEALYTFDHRASMTEQNLFDAAVSLAEWNLFSRRAIAKITGLSIRRVLVLAPKSDSTGGRFEPESLESLVKLVHVRERGEMDVFTAREALRTCSSWFASRATGIPRSTLLRWATMAEELEAA